MTPLTESKARGIGPLAELYAPIAEDLGEVEAIPRRELTSADVPTRLARLVVRRTS